LPNVISADKVLRGYDVGMNAAIIGGGLVGCETALYLANKGIRSVILEKMDEMLPAEAYRVQHYILYQLCKHSIAIYTGVTCNCITTDGLEILTRTKRKRFIKANTVIMALGADSNNYLEDCLKDLVTELYVIGDCKKPRTISDAVFDGASVANEL
jgi:2-enoate reductase